MPGKFIVKCGICDVECCLSDALVTVSAINDTDDSVKKYGLMVMVQCKECGAHQPVNHKLDVVYY
jgi:hypothetical protein